MGEVWEREKCLVGTRYREMRVVWECEKCLVGTRHRESGRWERCGNVRSVLFGTRHRDNGRWERCDGERRVFFSTRHRGRENEEGGRVKEVHITTVLILSQNRHIVRDKDL